VVGQWFIHPSGLIDRAIMWLTIDESPGYSKIRVRYSGPAHNAAHQVGTCICRPHGPNIPTPSQELGVSIAFRPYGDVPSAEKWLVLRGDSIRAIVPLIYPFRNQTSLRIKPHYPGEARAFTLAYEGIGNLVSGPRWLVALEPERLRRFNTCRTGVESLPMALCIVKG